MPQRGIDYQLLFGLLAFQNGFVSREQLLAGITDWLLDKSKPLADLLRERGSLAEERSELLAALVEKHFQDHQQDAAKSLAVLDSVGSICDELKTLRDPDLDRSLAWLPPAGSGPIEQSSQGFAVGASSSIGKRFRVLRPHARGGLGQVSVALDEELNREVALKEILPQHVASADSRSRFVLEAEITGGLEHPGIVPVYGLGQYADGRPFYAMRFIQGDSLQEAIERFHRGGSHDDPSRHRVLELRKMLGRFIDVCHAIEYAHSRGVLHRDLKPGNIMLGKYGETLVVDWGLAKTIGQGDSQQPVNDDQTLRPRSGSRSSATQQGVAIGTPAYMSPEQAAGRVDELGPTSDVYSLGATLYYLLTGRTPFAESDLGQLLEKARTGDFPRPRSVCRTIPPALEAICLKAMALKCDDRYPSPHQLAEDVEHWLADEPVASYTEPLAVRVRRSARKHPKTLAALTAALLVSLTSATIIAVIVSENNQQLTNAYGQLAAANTDLRKANGLEREARADADTRRRESEAVLAFFEEKVLAAARPKDQDGGLGIDATIRAAIDSVEPQIASSFTDQPLVEASIRDTLGTTYRCLGEAELAISQHERARQLRLIHLGPNAHDTLASANNLAEALKDADRLEEALSLYEDTLQRTTKTLGPTHPDRLTALNNLGTGYLAAGHVKQALSIFEENLERTMECLGVGHEDTLFAANNLANAYVADDRIEEALLILEKTLDVAKTALGPKHPSTLRMMNNLACVYEAFQQMDDALPLYVQTFELTEDALGPRHPDTLAAMGNLGTAYLAIGDVEKALTVLEDAMQRTKEARGPKHSDTLLAMNALAGAYQAAGRLNEALPIFEETLKLMKEVLGPNHPNTLTLMHNLATAYSAANRVDQALPLLVETVDRRKTVLGSDHADTLTSMNHLATAHLLAGQPEKALPMFEQFVATQKRLGRADDELFANTLAQIAHVLLYHEQFVAAEPYLRDCLRILAGTEIESWTSCNARSLLGRALSGQGRELLVSDKEQAIRLFAEAEPLLIAGYEGLKNLAPSMPPFARADLATAAKRLVDLYSDWSKPEQAALWQDRMQADARESGTGKTD